MDDPIINAHELAQRWLEAGMVKEFLQVVKDRGVPPGLVNSALQATFIEGMKTAIEICEKLHPEYKE